VATFIRDLLESAPRTTEFQFDHLDTSDRRDASNIGRWDAGNLALGFSNLAQMESRLAHQHYDLIYVPISQNIPAFIRDALFILQGRLHSARIVLQLHGGYFRDFYDKEAPGWFRAMARTVLNRAQAVIVLSEEFRCIFQGLVPSERIHVVENGVPDLFEDADAVRFPDSEKSPSAAATPRTTPTVLYMSTLARAKGILDLIQALALLRADIPGVKLRVAGNWSEADAQQWATDFVSRESLQNNIDFVGNVDGPAKRAFLMSGELFCLPTHYPYEGQPLAVLEAMSASLPVLATRHGALNSTVVDGATGRLLDRQCTPAELAVALRDMLATPALRAFGAAGRERYLERYTLAKCHERLGGVFEQALK
jgi:glycosyltransferase involved in cell wall biosynthesis